MILLKKIWSESYEERERERERERIIPTSQI
jgi:hypothetical protein